MEARAALDEHAQAAPLVHELAAAIDPTLAPLADAIHRAVEDDGSDVRDNASPKLRRLRKELREGRQRVAEELRRLARKSELREHLQEDFVTQRGGRPVLAVKASARRSVPGIVHDASSSGQTLFVEPFEVVELNNVQSEAASAEREEVERILRDLSQRVGAAAEAVTALVEATAAIDVVVAGGILSRGWRGAVVEPAGEVRLIGARHPLLDPAAAVPIDLELDSLQALVVSGPNAGGKTVALKTLGLAALLHQAGLRPPAESAALPVFDRVLADIGDQQSIEMSLSTFSGHVRNLVEILGSATEQSLVLLDELASGTDPVEGSALAQAILARLAAQARLTLVTTHYPELKEWASATDGVANAATGIDPETHAPLYRLALGRPGTSHALWIAERLGLDGDVVGDARERIAPERLRIGELLAEAEAADREAAADRTAAAEARAAAVESVAAARERERALADEIERVRASAAHERELAAAAAEEVSSPRPAPSCGRCARRSGAPGAETSRRGARPPERPRARSASASATAASARPRSGRPGWSSRSGRSTSRSRSRRRLRRGDPVEAPALGVRGTIAAIEGDEAEVVGAAGHRIRIPVARLVPDARGGAGADSEPETRHPGASRAPAETSRDELDVRGRRAQEAREAVRAFVDDAALAGLPLVRVVHGRGTGAVRTAVREELDGHPLVESRESESADGATLVHLAGS